LYRFLIDVTPESVEHSREIYSLLDLLGDLGGVTDVLVFLVGGLIFPIAEHHFIMKYLQKMFLVQTKEDHLFLEFKPVENSKKKFMSKNLKDSIPANLKDSEFEKEVSEHRGIRLGFKDFILVFIQSKCSFLSRCFWKRAEPKKLKRLISEGKKRITKDLSLEKIIKNLRILKILAQEKLKDDELKFLVHHNPKNVIFLDIDGSPDSEPRETDIKLINLVTPLTDVIQEQTN
jgi:hypothetical protein